MQSFLAENSTRLHAMANTLPVMLQDGYKFRLIPIVIHLHQALYIVRT